MRRAPKAAALLVAALLCGLLVIGPERMVALFLEWLPSIVIVTIIGLIIVWDGLYERKKRKERGE